MTPRRLSFPFNVGGGDLLTEISMLVHRRIASRFVIGVALLTVPVSAVDLLAQAPEAAGKRYALLVGVNQYHHAKLTPLKYAVNDVAELGKVLEAAGYEVTLLTDDAGKKDDKLVPTKANIERHLHEQAHRCQKGDTFLLAFTGHGLQFGQQKDAYYCPIDARPFEDETKTLVSITEVYNELEKSYAGVKVVLVDACRNDPTPGRGRGLDADTAPAPPKGVGVLFSCSAGQRAFEHDSLKHGVFFHYVLAGLRKEAADKKGRVTFDDLQKYVREEVPDKVHALFPDQKPDQAPNVKGEFTGKPLVLLTLKSAAIAASGDETGDEKRVQGDSKKKSPASDKTKAAAHTGTWLGLDWSFSALTAIGIDIKGNHDEDKNAIHWIVVAGKDISQISLFGSGYKAYFYDADDIRLKEVALEFTPNDNIKRGQKVRATLTLPPESILKKTKKVVVVRK
jgi:hypothetical protein